MKTLHMLLAIQIVILTACDSSISNNTSVALITETQISDKFGLTADTFAIGDDVIVTSTIKNQSNVERTIEFTAPLITVQIFSEDYTTLIFDPYYEFGFPQVVTETVIEPFGETGWSLIWRGTDNAGALVASGMYQVVVKFYGVINGYPPVRHDINIQLL